MDSLEDIDEEEIEEDDVAHKDLATRYAELLQQHEELVKGLSRQQTQQLDSDPQLQPGASAGYPSQPPAVAQRLASDHQTTQDNREYLHPGNPHTPLVTAPYPTIYNSPSQMPVRQPIKLVDLPQFHGDSAQWTMFKVNYDWTTSVYGYDQIHNYTRLEKALSGRARESVAGLMCNPMNVDLVMEELQNLFGQDRTIIRSHLAKIESFPPMRDHQHQELLQFTLEVTNAVGFIQSTTAASRLKDQTLLDKLVSILPEERRIAWARHLIQMLGGEADVKQFSLWLKQEANFIRMALETAPPAVASQARPKMINTVTVSPKTQAKGCAYCQNPTHQLANCPQFGELTIPERWSVVKTKRCCFGCLRLGHGMTTCRSKRPCGIAGCTRPHNQLLHEVESPPINPSIPAIRASNAFIESSTTGLYKFVPVRVAGPHGQVETIAFIDDGSKASLVEEDLAKELGLIGQPRNIQLQWFNGEQSEEKSSQVTLEIGSVTAKNLLTVKRISMAAQSLDAEDMKAKNPALRDIPIKSYLNARPRILLGIPHYNLIRPIRTVNVGDNYSVQETRIGWTVAGGTCHGEEQCVMNISALPSENDDQIVSLQPIEHTATEDEKRAVRLLEPTTRQVGDRNETGLLLCSDTPPLPSPAESYKQAFRRLDIAEAKMRRDKDLEEWYQAKISENIKKGYAYKNKNNKRRLVFDTAAKCQEPCGHLRRHSRNVPPCAHKRKRSRRPPFPVERGDLVGFWRQGFRARCVGERTSLGCLSRYGRASMVGTGQDDGRHTTATSFSTGSPLTSPPRGPGCRINIRNRRQWAAPSIRIE